MDGYHLKRGDATHLEPIADAVAVPDCAATCSPPIIFQTPLANDISGAGASDKSLSM